MERDRTELFVTAALAVVTVATLIGLGVVGAGRTQRHLDRACATGDPVSCALDGRH